MRSTSLAALLFAASCAPAPPSKPAPSPPPRPAAPASAAAPPPTIPDAERQTLLERAYADWRLHGDITVFRPLLAAAPSITPGLPREAWIHVAVRPDGARAALDLGRAVLYVDARSGEPLTSIAGGELHPDGFIDGLLRVADALIDPERGHVHLVSLRFAARGRRAWVLQRSGERCVAVEWDLTQDRVIRALEPVAVTEDNPQTCDADPRVTPEGIWLVIPAGQWHLRTGRFQRFPGDVANAISHDGRYLAFFGPRDQREHANFVTLVDLRTGRRTRPRIPIGWLSNGTPLSFLASPPRLVVTDYGIYHFEVPSGRLVAPVGDPEYPDGRITRDLTPRPRPRSAAEQALVARVAERVCHADGLVFPRAACDSVFGAARGPIVN